MRQQLTNVSLAQKLVNVAVLLKTDGFVRQSAGKVFGNYENYRQQTTPEQRQWVQQVKKGGECKIEDVPEFRPKEKKMVRLEVYLSPSRHEKFTRLCQQARRNKSRYVNHLIAREIENELQEEE